MKLVRRAIEMAKARGKRKQEKRVKVARRVAQRERQLLKKEINEAIQELFYDYPKESALKRSAHRLNELAHELASVRVGYDRAVEGFKKPSQA